MKLTVYGTPAPQGSKRFVGHSKAGRGIMVESSAKVKPWRQAVTWAAREAMGEGFQRMDGPICMEVTFALARPKSKPKRVLYPDTKPDLSKLIRSTEDALTDAGVWADDSRVVSCNARKFYVGDPNALDTPGAVIHFWEVRG